MDALEAIYRAQEQWPDVIDVKMQRAAALEEPADEDRGVPSGRRALARDGPGAGQGDARLAEDPRDRSARTTRPSSSSRSSTRPRGRWEPLIELYLARLDTREETADKTDLLRRIARVFEEKLDDKNQALDALINALGEDFHDRETAKYLERMAQATGAGASSSRPPTTGCRRRPSRRRRSASACTSPSGTARTSVTPSTRSRTTRRSSRSTRTTSARCARWGSSIARTATGSSSARRSRARSTSPSRDVDRKEILHRARRAARQPDEPDRPGGRRTTSARSRSTRCSSRRSRTSSASTPRAARTSELVDILDAQGAARSTSPPRSRRRSCASARSTSRLQRLAEGRRRCTARCSRSSRTNLLGLRGLERVYETLEQWPELVQRARGAARRRHDASVSASTS